MCFCKLCKGESASKKNNNILTLELIDIRERAIGKGIDYLISNGNPPKIKVKKEIPEDIKRKADEALFIIINTQLTHN